MPVYLLTAAQVPAPMVPGSLIDPDDETTVAAEVIASGTHALEMKGLFNANAARLDNLGRYGGGVAAVNSGGEFSVDVEPLTLAVSEAIITPLGSQVHADAQTLALSDNLYSDGDLTVRAHIWMSITGVLSARTDTTQPGSSSVYLGSVRTRNGALVDFDYSGRISLVGGLAYRRTADAEEPGDADDLPSAVRFLHRTEGGLYLWDGEQYTRLSVESTALSDSLTTLQSDYDLLRHQFRQQLRWTAERFGFDFIHPRLWNEAQLAS